MRCKKRRPRKIDLSSGPRSDRRVGYIRQPRTTLLATSRHPIMINVWQRSVAKLIALTRQKPELLPKNTDNFLLALIVHLQRHHTRPLALSGPRFGAQ
jgi:hypothetical protein